MPTEAALALRPYAENLAATAAALMRAASGEVGKIEGTVRISASDIIGVEMLPPIVALMQEVHPGWKLSFLSPIRWKTCCGVRPTSPSA